MILIIGTMSAAADTEDVTVMVDGKDVGCLSYGSSAIVVDGITMVPLRAIFEALGAEVQWENWQAYGWGAFYWVDGSEYVGAFENGNIHEQGTYYWSDGSKCIGEFENDKRHGQGTYYFADGGADTGTWINGEYIGK